MLPELKPDSQVQVLSLIGERGDTSSIKLVKQVLNSKDESVRLTAIDAISKIGTEAAAKELLQVAATGRGETQEAAIGGLAIMTGAGVEETIKAQAASGDVNGRVVAIDLLGLRHSPGATQILLAYASDYDEQINAAAYKALVNVAGTDDIPALIDLLTNAKSSTARKNATATLKSILAETPDNDKDTEAKVIITKMQQAKEGDVKLSLLSSLNALGGPTALNVVIEATQSTDESMKDCGIRTLSDWPDYEAAEILLDIASKPETSLIHYVLATRGAMRLIGASDSASIDERAALCMRAFDIARRDEEKKQVISTMGSLPSTEVAEKLLTFTTDENLKTEAALAAVELAGNMLRTNRQAATDIARKIREMNISEEVNSRADRIISGRFFGFPGGPRRERPGGMNRRR
jgi:HEAT repeat protein